MPNPNSDNKQAPVGTGDELRQSLEPMHDDAVKKKKNKQPIRLEYMIDTSNRIFDSNFDRYSYMPKKGGSTTYTHLAITFILRMLLLPILSTVYVFSRLALIVFNPEAYRHNPAKATLMMSATLMAIGTGIGLGLGTSLFSAQTMMNIAGSVGGGAAVVGLVGIVAFATLLHIAKTTAQLMNTQTLNDPYALLGPHVYITAPKHHLPYKMKNLLDAVEDLQRGVLVNYYKHIKEPPITASFRALTLKPVLTTFEAIAKAKEKNSVTPGMLNDLNTALNAAVAEGHSHRSLMDAQHELANATIENGVVKLRG